jgi:hypothetical protein
VAEDKLFVYPPDDTKQGLLFSLEQLLTVLPKVRWTQQQDLPQGQPV